MQFTHLVSLIIIGIFIALISVFITLYLQGAFRSQVRYRLRHLPRPDADGFACFAASLSDSFLTSGKPIGFWLGAEQIFSARLDFIRAAQESIWFETFWMTPGQRTEEFAQAIADRAKAGVTVQLLVDDHGTEAMPSHYWQRLRDIGVEIRFFNPFSWRSPLDYLNRTHRKLLIIDGKTVLIGGAGVSDMWDGLGPRGNQTPWFDFEIAF